MKQTRIVVKLIQYFFFDEIELDKDVYCRCIREDFTYATSPNYDAHRIITQQAANTVHCNMMYLKRVIHTKKNKYFMTTMTFSSIIQGCLGETALKVTEKLEFIERIFFE